MKRLRCTEVLRLETICLLGHKSEWFNILLRNAQPFRYQDGIDPVLGVFQVRAIQEETYLDLRVLVASSSDSQLLVVCLGEGGWTLRK